MCPVAPLEGRGRSIKSQYLTGVTRSAGGGLFANRVKHHRLFRLGLRGSFGVFDAHRQIDQISLPLSAEKREHCPGGEDRADDEDQRHLLSVSACLRIFFNQSIAYGPERKLRTPIF